MTTSTSHPGPIEPVETPKPTIDTLQRTVESLEQQLETQRARIDALEFRLANTESVLRLEHRHDLLRQRAVIAGRLRDLDSATPPKVPDPSRGTLDDYTRELAAIFPRSSAAWETLLAPNEEAYRTDPIGNLSTRENDLACQFGRFASVYLRGRVLDVGCGPAPLPTYLEGHPLDSIAGVDPLPPFEPHPFLFVRGVAEFLPWADGSFDTVITATSLDHVVSPERSLQEMARVLAPTGRLLAWLGFLDEAEDYDPEQETIEPVDEFHLFHFSRRGFEELASRFFEIEESFDLDGLSHFYALRQRG